MKWSELTFPTINLYSMPKFLDSINSVLESESYKDTAFLTFKTEQDKLKFLEAYNKRKNN